MRFKHQARKLREIRERMGFNLVQMERAMGYPGYRGGGQKISNAENGLCGIPVSRWLNILKNNRDKQDVVDAMVADYEDKIMRRMFPEEK